MDVAQLAARYGYPSEYSKYDTQFAGLKEAIGWTLWDVNPYVSGATTALAFFTVAKATLDLSNMEIQGQLASPKAFFLRAIRVKLYAAPHNIAFGVAPIIEPGLIRDFQQLLEQGVLQLTIGMKVYGQWPLWMLPSAGGISPTMVSGAPADDIQYANNGAPDARNAYTLSKPLFIAPQINFRCDLLWPAGAVVMTTAAALSPLNIWVGLDGDLIRPVQ